MLPAACISVECVQLGCSETRISCARMASLHDGVHWLCLTQQGRRSSTASSSSAVRVLYDAEALDLSPYSPTASHRPWCDSPLSTNGSASAADDHVSSSVSSSRAVSPLVAM